MKEIYVVAAIIEKDDKILCMQRDIGKYEYVSLKWEFPGGKIEEGETKEYALKRELQEKMEIDIDIINHFCDVRHVYPDFILNMYCYLCTTSDLKFKLNVHKNFKWLPKEQLQLLDWASADLPIVKKLMEGKNEFWIV